MLQFLSLYFNGVSFISAHRLIFVKNIFETTSIICVLPVFQLTFRIQYYDIGFFLTNCLFSATRICPLAKTSAQQRTVETRYTGGGQNFLRVLGSIRRGETGASVSARTQPASPDAKCSQSVVQWTQDSSELGCPLQYTHGREGKTAKR
jgi:hypothetical protein